MKKNTYDLFKYECREEKERIRAFSATLTGRFGIGTVRLGAEGSRCTERLILIQHSPYL
jgi:hypothetical protein